MALFYVNDHLISEEITGNNSWPNTNETYNRIMLKTTPMATRKVEGGKGFEPFSRNICAHNCSLLSNANTRISSTINEGAFVPRITIRTSSDTHHDSDIFLVALPYDGLIVPFEHDEKKLQIYKTMIVKSEQHSIEHLDRKYKRVIYLVVRPYYGGLGNDGWYDADLKITFAQSNKAREGDAGSTWNFKHTTVRFGENGMYDIQVEEETAPYDAINPDDLRNQPICKLVEPTQITNNGGNNYRK